jgi:hypothetical protein
MTAVMRECRAEVGFSCIYKSARKQIVKSAPGNNVANRMRANKQASPADLS